MNTYSVMVEELIGKVLGVRNFFVLTRLLRLPLVYATSILSTMGENLQFINFLLQFLITLIPYNIDRTEGDKNK